ncbi:aminotransferase class V-fold PLP-dependent enzyme [Klebsiella pneumoniae]|uniref:aminotransferase class V-fold PLP-dependent enzyme n=1 Tax=Klebsiella pneumoniae TaxID=573 RepID=UPI00073993DB|nr:aminotransferase class V-fold PLP-dependent enzyme [Klebsiella pneumoniae]AUA50831.1 aminotransferase class V-fold PLP-dependent enzyme [Klebsiella pneumoniae]EIV9695159.1 aminotransferase class V-fold PLP-dependent enzyme [Klebsiella pneumoniae]EIV9703660.1 aminotransferase class V-fold PLP-dependent enzyme [Klebsiella pneumoniae]EIW0101861.1 aminotransferase class V-fold PLP-dependent enzyme [Klebsiella pneumoniae]EKW8520164.1 aminotransferase class V-fold PLP-dependent enzyme [Klebsiella
MTFSVEQVRADFPVLNREVNGQPLVYLDSAASAQKPEAVIGAEAEFYRHGYAAVHRGIHTLSAEATALIALAHQHGAKVLVDGAQAVMHHPVDVQALGCDFYVFSAHKLYGPTGIGVLYARSELLQTMAPWEGGGSMIATVSLTEGTTWNQAPWRFEAGTPNTGGIIGLGAALTYVSQLGLTQIAEYEQTLMRYALDALRAVPDLILYGPAQRKGVIAFNLGQHHAYDVGSFLDNYGIAVRTGHHCAMPLMARYQVPAMCRASLAMYNTTEEVDRLVAGLQRIRKLLG